VKPKTFRLISLGCAKNLVDSEGIAGSLVAAGWQSVAAGPADLVLVSTCAFIEDAAQESVDTLLEEIEHKKKGQTRWVGAIGCLPEKYREELAEAMPELDLVAGVGDLPRLAALVEEALGGNCRIVSFTPSGKRYQEVQNRLLSTPRHRAYLKIAEGCDNACGFCIIGRLRGPFRSRPLAAILAEAETMAATGVREISLVAQDLTRYGLDLKPSRSLVELLTALANMKGSPWIRMLYAHPARVDEGLAATIAAHASIVPYLDMPLQHAADHVLKRMGRPQTGASSQAAVELLRRLVPDLAIRTTFLVGHPGETEKDFQVLLDFIEKNRFPHVGAFAWSPEEGTPSFSQTDWVSEKVRRKRLDRLLTLQQRISAERAAEWIGREVEILVEEVLHKHNRRAYSHIGRIAQQAPEVDGVTYLRAPTEDACRPGDIVRAKITRSDIYDLFADLCSAESRAEL